MKSSKRACPIGDNMALLQKNADYNGFLVGRTHSGANTQVRPYKYLFSFLIAVTLHFFAIRFNLKTPFLIIPQITINYCP